jgi:Co/Zn/Cd efflux system component
MADCCSDKACEIEALRETQSATLKGVLAINVAMFLVEGTAGVVSGSTALLGDSLDMLGDALVYGFSLYVVARGLRWKAFAALFKGGIMAAFGLFVLGQVVYRLLFPHVPAFETIGAVGLLALAANAVCLALLWRHRADDINMRSIWLCSRNDIIANVAVLFAAVGVWAVGSGWPDLLVGLGLAVLFLRTAVYVLTEAAAGLKPEETVKYRIEAGPSQLDIKIEGTGEKQKEILEAFGECQAGRCTCPTTEYQKLESLQVEATGDSIKLQLRPKAGTQFDLSEIEQCLQHTVTKATED